MPLLNLERKPKGGESLIPLRIPIIQPYLKGPSELVAMQVKAFILTLWEMLLAAIFCIADVYPWKSGSYHYPLKSSR